MKLPQLWRPAIYNETDTSNSCSTDLIHQAEAEATKNAGHSGTLPPAVQQGPATKGGNDDYHRKDAQHGAVGVKSCREHGLDRTAVLSILIALVGAGVAGAFLSMGFVGARRDQDLRFARKASEIVLAVKDRWDDYVGAALWIHEACRSTADQTATLGEQGLKICSREDFSELYEYLLADKGLNFQAMAFSPWIKRSDRTSVEAEAREYYNEYYPDLLYWGITGYEQLPGSNETIVFVRSEQDDYMPVQYVEPVVPNKEFLGFDICSIGQSHDDVQRLLRYKPVVSNRIDVADLLPDSSYQPGYYVLLVHPGIPLSNHQSTPDSSSQLFLKAATIAETAVRGLVDSDFSVYLFDVSDNSEPGAEFLGMTHCHEYLALHEDAESLDSHSEQTESSMPHKILSNEGSHRQLGGGSRDSTEKESHYSLPEPRLEDLEAQSHRCMSESIPIAQNTWYVSDSKQCLHINLRSCQVLTVVFWCHFIS